MTSSPPAAWEPRRPHLVAFAFLGLWILLLSLPMWSGQLVAGPHSDQYATGYAIRWWGAAQWRATGHLPLWNPLIFGGMPIVAGFGDLFYPTAWLRLVLPTVTAMNLAFVVHYILAGFFAYLFLRMLGLSWLGSLVGGTAYQLSGIVASLVSPGHDGKLFVTALLPVMLIALLTGIRRRRPEGFALLGLAVGLALLSPQYQMAQYALLTSGIFTLYLLFAEPEGITARERWMGLAWASLGVVLGFGVSLIQVLPFFHYIPYSPRAEGAGYAWSVSYAMPWSHVPELLFSGFTGRYETYWGPNPLKLHSEYLGLPVVALAAIGVGSPRRKLVWLFVGLATLFLLVSLGGATPFYHLWYAVVPYVRKTRAPGMALYVTALAVSCLAALGVERIERGEGKRHLQIAAGVATFAALLAAAGVFGQIARALALSGAEDQGRSAADAVAAALPGIQLGALGSAVALALLAGLGLAWLLGRIPARAFATLLVILVGADLWRAGREFWHWSRPEQEIYASDPIIEHLAQTPMPYRVFDTGLYPGTSLMRHQIPQVLGYHGNELRFYDDLLGGKNVWRNLGTSPHLWQLLAVRYLIVGDTISIPGYHYVLGPAQTGGGRTAYLYEADTVPPYARVIPEAVKGDSDRIVATLVDPRLDYDRLLLYAPAEPLNPHPVLQMPEPSPSRATVSSWAPGRMTITLDPAPPKDSYLLVAENWYPDWRATVDGETAPVLRGDQTFLSVPLPAGARHVELSFESNDYYKGRRVTVASLGLLLAWGAGAAARRRLRGA